MDAPTVSERKNELRKTLKARLKAIDCDRLAVARSLYGNLLKLDAFRDAKVVGIYVDFQEEAPTRPIIPLLFEENERQCSKIVAVPYCLGSAMFFNRLNRPRVVLDEPILDDLEPVAPYGILEPRESFRNDPTRVVEPSEIDALIVPGLAFDASGRRLGRGAGYYDRFIPKLRSDAALVGYCFDEQIVDGVPTDDFDARVSYIATPSGLIRAA